MKTKKEDKAVVEATATPSVKVEVSDENGEPEVAATDENKEPEAATDNDKAQEGAATDKCDKTDQVEVNENQEGSTDKDGQEVTNEEIKLSEDETMFSCFKCQAIHILKSDYRPQRKTCGCGAKYRVVYRKGQLSVLAQK